MVTITATLARQTLYNLVDEVSLSHEPVQIGSVQNISHFGLRQVLG